MHDWIFAIMPLLIGWTLDLLLGDPARLQHPVVWFGRLIATCEHRLNHGSRRKLKGALTAIALITGTYAATWLLRQATGLLPSCGGSPSPAPHAPLFTVILDGILVFYCLAGTTLVREVRAVFRALGRSLEDGRRQVGRIVGRDTSQLSAQEIRTAALETLAENLSDGVIAPLFWYALLGTPGMMAYKMVNTLDSMIGYRTERYKDFGCCAARIDDAANYIPARLTALLMIISAKLMAKGKSHAGEKHGGLLRFVWRHGRNHASPNSGWPEAALAAILDCRFGGPHYYFGELVDKPYIGDNPRELTTADMQTAVRINRGAEVIAIIIITTITCCL